MDIVLCNESFKRSHCTPVDWLFAEDESCGSDVGVDIRNVCFNPPAGSWRGRNRRAILQTGSSEPSRAGDSESAVEVAVNVHSILWLEQLAQLGRFSSHWSKSV